MTIEEIFNDETVSEWVKYSLHSAMQRNAFDAAKDADIVAKALAERAAAWQTICASSPDVGGMKRLTLNIPASLHLEIKMQCAMRGTQMTEEVLELLQTKYGKA